jgi:hypothetical protein
MVRPRGESALIVTKLACLCFMAALIFSLASGVRQAASADFYPGVSVQQISATAGQTAPHKSCPFGNHSGSLGTCVTAGFVALEQSTANPITRSEPRTARFAMTPSAALASSFGDRLERPPRF